MIEIYINGKTQLIPDSFAELSTKHIKHYFKQIVKQVEPEVLRLDFAFRIVKHIPKFKIMKLKYLYERSPELYADEYEEMNCSLRTLGDAFSFITGIRHISNRPFANIGLRIGPANEFKNISLWEFALAEKCHRDFIATEDTIYLKKMASIFYRHVSIFKLLKSIVKKQADIRTSVPNNPKALNIPDWKLAALNAWFCTFFDSLPKRYPMVFKKKNSDSTFGNEGSPWGDIIMALSGDIPGNEEKVSNMSFYLIMERLEYIGRRAEEIKNIK